MCHARTARGSRWQSLRSAACCRVRRCWAARCRGGALLGRGGVGRRGDAALPGWRCGAAGVAHDRGDSQPGRRTAPERSLAYLGKNVPKTASVGPCFDTFLPEKMVDLLVGRRINATTTSAGSSAPSARPRARRISHRCSMSCEPATATKVYPGRIPRAPRGGRRQIGC